MPIYEYRCPKCGFIREELKKVEEADNVPDCVYCKNQLMDRIFTPITLVMKERSQDYLRKRSIEQGKKFFKRHKNFQEMSEKSVNEKPIV